MGRVPKRIDYKKGKTHEELYVIREASAERLRAMSVGEPLTCRLQCEDVAPRKGYGAYAETIYTAHVRLSASGSRSDALTFDAGVALGLPVTSDTSPWGVTIRLPRSYVAAPGGHVAKLARQLAARLSEGRARRIEVRLTGPATQPTYAGAARTASSDTQESPTFSTCYADRVSFLKKSVTCA